MKKITTFLFLLAFLPLCAQNFDVAIGPIYGHYTDSTRNFWILLNPYNQDDRIRDWTTQLNSDLYKYFETKINKKIIKITYSNVVGDGYVLVNGVVKEPKLLPEKQDITFLIGSCAFPYPFTFWSGKNKEVIFESMAKQDKDFMIWMGDNVYYLFGEWKDKAKMHQKNLKMRFNPKLRGLLESCPQYAIWDDHDYGPNDSDTHYGGKYESLKIFKEYWLNPSYGLDSAAGVFCHFSQADADFFLLDARFYATDSTMLGTTQMEWLKTSLKASKANFKFIVSGTQVLADNPSGEDLGDFGNERKNLLDFLQKENITGVIFFSGDRHYAEMMKLEREGTYPLYEMTSSPLTSLINPSTSKNNPTRLDNTLVRALNFGKIHLIGEGENRQCRLELMDKNGQIFWKQEIRLSDLR